MTLRSSEYKLYCGTNFFQAFKEALNYLTSNNTKIKQNGNRFSQ